MKYLVEHAERELKLAKFNSDDFVGGFINRSVMDLVKTFEKQNLPSSAGDIILDIFNILVSGGILTPITGDDSEWKEINTDGNVEYQNIRDPHVIKSIDNQVRYTKGILLLYSDNSASFGKFYPTKEDAINNTNRIDGTVINSFPFTPKTFQIEVEDEMSSDGRYLVWAKHPDKLIDVWNHYSKLQSS